jgi:hypothetical protein
MKAEHQTDTTRLDELASEINRLHDAAISAVRTALQNAIRAGEVLASAKAILPHGSWYGWLQDHTDVGVRQAQRYMKLYRERDKINASSATHLSNALEIVSAPKAKVVHLSADDATDDGSEFVGNVTVEELDETTAAVIREVQVSSKAAECDDNLDQSVDEGKQQPVTVYRMEDLMSVDGLYSLVSVWNSSGPDARRKFVELIDGDISEIRIEHSRTPTDAASGRK